MNELVEFWHDLVPNDPPFVHPQDFAAFEHLKVRWNGVHSFEEYISSKWFGVKDDKTLHTGLIPEPFSGDLESADIFVLLLNPGLSIIDYHAETRSQEIRDVRWGNLRQENSRWDFPYPWLNPNFCWHGGYAYFEGRLRGIVRRLAEARFGGVYLAALQHLSRRFATVEMVPYHSTSYGADRVAKNLPSVAAVKHFVQERLVPRAIAGEITIIVARKVFDWGLPSGHERIVQYSGTQARAAHLTSNSSGGEAILRQLGLEP